jgi:hypothetical protein
MAIKYPILKYIDDGIVYPFELTLIEEQALTLVQVSQKKKKKLALKIGQQVLIIVLGEKHLILIKSERVVSYQNFDYLGSSKDRALRRAFPLKYVKTSFGAIPTTGKSGNLEANSHVSAIRLTNYIEYPFVNYENNSLFADALSYQKIPVGADAVVNTNGLNYLAIKTKNLGDSVISPHGQHIMDQPNPVTTLTLILFAISAHTAFLGGASYYSQGGFTLAKPHFHGFISNLSNNIDSTLWLPRNGESNNTAFWSTYPFINGIQDYRVISPLFSLFGAPYTSILFFPLTYDDVAHMRIKDNTSPTDKDSIGMTVSIMDVLEIMAAVAGHTVIPASILQSINVTVTDLTVDNPIEHTVIIDSYTFDIKWIVSAAGFFFQGTTVINGLTFTFTTHNMNITIVSSPTRTAAEIAATNLLDQPIPVEGDTVNFSADGYSRQFQGAIYAPTFSYYLTPYFDQAVTTADITTPGSRDLRLTYGYDSYGDRSDPHIGIQARIAAGEIPVIGPHYQLTNIGVTELGGVAPSHVGLVHDWVWNGVVVPASYTDPIYTLTVSWSLKGQVYQLRYDAGNQKLYTIPTFIPPDNLTTLLGGNIDTTVVATSTALFNFGIDMSYYDSAEIRRFSGDYTYGQYAVDPLPDQHIGWPVLPAGRELARTVELVDENFATMESLTYTPSAAFNNAIDDYLGTMIGTVTACEEYHDQAFADHLDAGKPANTFIPTLDEFGDYLYTVPQVSIDVLTDAQSKKAIVDALLPTTLAHNTWVSYELLYSLTLNNTAIDSYFVIENN